MLTTSHRLAAALAVIVALAVPAPAAATQLWLPYKPAGYYLEFVNCCRPVAQWPGIKLDARGIPMVTYDQGKTYVYNPVTVGLFGLQAYSWFKRSGKAADRTNAVRAADWFVSYQRGDGIWPYNFSWPVGGMGVTLPAGWGSAMAQGLGISMLARASTLGSTVRYLAAARRAVPAMIKPVNSGGLMTPFLDDTRYPFYEEYPTRPASLTLNGFMFSLIGLYDLAQLGKDARARQVFDRGYRTLAYGLPYYDLGDTTAYHLGHLTNPPRPVYMIPSYHSVHVMLLRALNSVVPHPTIADFADRWATYAPCNWLCAA